ncbi:MAG: tetratricopeptide repeat protein [Candidatus Omnitrophota bacterium]
MQIKYIILTFAILLFQSAAFAFTVDDVYKDYLSDDCESALIKAKKLKEDDDVLYILGLVYLKIGNYPQARDYFQRLQNNFPRSEFYQQSLLKFADSYFMEENFQKAKTLYEQIIQKYPSCNYKSMLYLRLAQIANKEGNWEEKKKYTNLIKEKHPQCSEVRFIDTLDSGCDFFTVQIGAFSSKKNAYALMKEISQEYEAYIAEDARDGLTLYKVRIGKFKERKEATRLSIKLLKKGYPARIYP